MKGAVAAGHPVTAQAGAQILEAGGNAVDACVAAGFVSWVVESPLTGPGAGGFMLVHRASDHSDRLLDFFVALPGLGLQGHEAAAMDEIEVPFDAQTTQLFRIGGASCAVPGSVAGLGRLTGCTDVFPGESSLRRLPRSHGMGSSSTLSRPSSIRFWTSRFEPRKRAGGCTASVGRSRAEIGSCRATSQAR